MPTTEHSNNAAHLARPKHAEQLTLPYSQVHTNDHEPLHITYPPWRLQCMLATLHFDWPGLNVMLSCPQ